MDESNRRPHLPALSILPPKHEEELAGRISGSAPHIHSSASAPSPMHSYTGPPPPYGAVRTAPPVAHPWSGASQPVHTRLEPRRTSVDERDGPKPVVRQSLPSLSEIMSAAEPPIVSNAPPAPPPSSILPPHAPQTRPIDHLSHSPSPQRMYAPASSAAYPPYAPARPEEQARPPFVSHDSGNTIYATSEDSRATGNISSTHPSPRDSMYRGHREHSPADHPMHSSAPMGPPVAPYGYASYPARQEYTQQPPAGPLYQPSSVYGPPTTAAPAWRPESASYPPHHRPEEYKETVKRHLDTQHLEFALNEVTRSSDIISDFARRYTDQLYASRNSLLTTSKLPSIVEIDDMATKSKVQLDQLMNIRDFILSQQTTPFDHHSAPPVDSRHASTSEKPLAMTGGDHSPHDSEDKMSGYGPDSKKPRRGRAAPPGRCHSCNRAETPEWRRGPDGARTLCNACGLHYAKLTRKNQNSNGVKSAPMSNNGSSNLRPKEGMGH